jgi:hypothetical protein
MVPSLVQHPGPVRNDLAVLDVLEDVGVELPALEFLVAMGGREGGREEGRGGKRG